MRGVHRIEARPPQTQGVESFYPERCSILSGAFSAPVPMTCGDPWALVTAVTVTVLQQVHCHCE